MTRRAGLFLLLAATMALSGCGGYHQAKRGKPARAMPVSAPTHTPGVSVATATPGNPITVETAAAHAEVPGQLMGLVTASGTGAAAVPSVSQPAYIAVTPGAVPVGYERVAVGQPAVGAAPAPQAAVPVYAATTQPRPQARPATIQTASAAAVVPVTPTRSFARGKIHSACMASDRKARSNELCGCIQAVADRTLTSAEQTTAAGFYRDPHQAQVVRQSDSPADERFWKTYTNYAETAKRTCG